MAQKLVLDLLVWLYISLITELGKQRQTDLYEFKVSLVYRVSSGQLGPQSETCLRKTKAKQNSTGVIGVT